MIVSLYFFFFFKQKTAYEMRISDWSSDVCSSDLPGGRFRNESLQEKCRGDGAGIGSVADIADIGHGRPQHLRVGLVERQAPDRIGQIGRASCRERVCQYV